MTQPPSQEPDVQGIPRSLISSLCGMAALLAFVGILCEFFAVRDQLELWLKFTLMVFLPSLVLAVHVYQAKKQGAPVFSAAFFAFLAVNALLMPVIMFLSWSILTMISGFLILLYALSLLWYGAFYHHAMLISAAMALAFAAALSIPLWLFNQIAIGGAFLILLGGAVFGLAFYLRGKREQRIAQMQVAQKRQEAARASLPPDEH